MKPNAIAVVRLRNPDFKIMELLKLVRVFFMVLLPIDILQIHNPKSPNHPIRPRQHIRRNREADLLGGFEIDDELKLRRPFHRQLGGLGAF
jgi:hypothetical protein